MLNDALPTDLPTPEALVTELRARLGGFQNITWTAQTGSTNADLLAQARHSTAPWLLGSHQQVSGRGRAGRPWENQSGATLMFSCAFPVHLPPVRLPALSPLAGLAAGEALRHLAGDADALRVKWPNDLQWHEAKLAGILVESAKNLVMPDVYTIVIGMGLNLTGASQLSQHLGRSVADWSTVLQESGHPAVSVSDIVCAAANAWRKAIHDLETAGFEQFQQRFSAMDALAGREINVIDQGALFFSGIARGLDEHARLRVETDKGFVPVSVGEISIRPRTAEQKP